MGSFGGVPLGFDTKTLWIALAISNLVFGALMLVHIGHGGERGREWGALRLWASAQVLKGVSIGLIVAKTAFSFPWSYSGNLRYIGGHFVELLAFLSYAGLGHRVRSASLVFAGLLAVYAAGILGRLEINLLAVLFTASLAVLYGLSAAALWAAGRRRSLELRQNRPPVNGLNFYLLSGRAKGFPVGDHPD